MFSSDTTEMNLLCLAICVLVCELAQRGSRHQSSVQIAILQLFVRTDCLLPNMFVGTLTSKSVVSALERGITAEMLVKYLEDHRHPRIANRHPVVPEAVSDQLLLWQTEMRRLDCTPAVMYDAFESEALFEGTVAKAKELNAVLFLDSKLRRLVAHGQAHAAIRSHIQAMRQRANAAAGATR